MNSNDFTYKKTKTFINETDVDTFDPFEYLQVVPVKDPWAPWRGPGTLQGGSSTLQGGS